MTDRAELLVLAERDEMRRPMTRIIDTLDEIPTLIWGVVILLIGAVIGAAFGSRR